MLFGGASVWWWTSRDGGGSGGEHVEMVECGGPGMAMVTVGLGIEISIYKNTWSQNADANEPHNSRYWWRWTCFDAPKWWLVMVEVVMPVDAPMKENFQLAISKKKGIRC